MRERTLAPGSCQRPDTRLGGSREASRLGTEGLAGSSESAPPTPAAEVPFTLGCEDAEAPASGQPGGLGIRANAASTQRAPRRGAHQVQERSAHPVPLNRGRPARDPRAESSAGRAGRTAPGPRRSAEQQGRSANSSGKTETATRGGSALERGRKKDTPYAAPRHAQVGVPQDQTERPGQPSEPGGGAQARRC